MPLLQASYSERPGKISVSFQRLVLHLNSQITATFTPLQTPFITLHPVPHHAPSFPLEQELFTPPAQLLLFNYWITSTASYLLCVFLETATPVCLDSIATEHSLTMKHFYGSQYFSLQSPWIWCLCQLFSCYGAAPRYISTRNHLSGGLPCPLRLRFPSHSCKQAQNASERVPVVGGRKKIKIADVKGKITKVMRSICVLVVDGLYQGCASLWHTNRRE